MARRGRRQRAASATRPRRKPRPLRWVVLAVGLVAGVWSLHKVLAPRRPMGSSGSASGFNVLLITIDTTRADHLGCYGRIGGRTPNIDRLAGEGIRFTRCTACSPITLPSHASIMTAMYPYVHGARQNGTGRLAAANVTLAETLREEGYRAQATVACFVLNELFGIGQGFEVYHDVPPAPVGDPARAERKGDEIADDAIGMLQSLAGERFFMWVHFYDPHYPYESPRVRDPLSPRAYEDEIAFMDAQIGRVLSTLEQLDLERKTLVVVVADHGEGLGDHDEVEHGYFLYQTTVHVPLILRCPGTIPAERTVAASVRTVDIAPTILELVGLPPWDHAQGVSLCPLLTGQQQDLNLAAYAESLNAHVEYGLSPMRSLSAGDWKYILVPKPELYCLADDAAETRNLLTDRPGLAAEMREQLRLLIADSPPPPAAADSTTDLTSDQIARLESLGYVASATGVEDDDQTELDRFEPKGGDPKDHARVFVAIDWELPKLMRQKEYASAERLLREAMQAMPAATRLPAQLAAVLGEQGRGKEAIEAFERAVALGPGDKVVRMKYGAFLGRAGQHEEALAQFTTVLRKMPDDIGALNDAALALTALGRLEKAEEHLRWALELAPRNARALRILGLVREQQNRPEEAVRCFKEALAIDPSFNRCKVDLRRVQRMP